MFLLLLHVTPLILSRSHLSFLILSKGGTGRNLNLGGKGRNHHPIRCTCRLYCLSLALSHVHCLSWADLFSFYFLARLYSLSCSLTQLFLLTLAHLPFLLREEHFGMTSTILWYRLQCLHLSLSLVLFLFKIIFLTFTSLFHFPSQENRQGIHQPLLLSGWWRVNRCICYPDIVGDSVAEQTVRDVQYLMIFAATVSHVWSQNGTFWLRIFEWQFNLNSFYHLLQTM